MYKKWIWRRQT